MQMKSAEAGCSALLFITTVIDSTTTTITTGRCSPVTWTKDSKTAEPTVTPSESVKYLPDFPQGLQPGEVNCREHAWIPDEVDANTCRELAKHWDMSIEKLFMLNPTWGKDCTGLEPGEFFCSDGFIEPLRAHDGRCGPPNNDATCVGVKQGQCCNSETWTCGESEHDCARGVCYEGICWGHKYFITDGTCGHYNGKRLCDGKWGECCSKEGQCGTGPDFCGFGSCQSGKCEMPTDKHGVPLEIDVNEDVQSVGLGDDSTPRTEEPFRKGPSTWLIEEEQNCMARFGQSLTSGPTCSPKTIFVPGWYCYHLAHAIADFQSRHRIDIYAAGAHDS